jgi:hypothetical protein
MTKAAKKKARQINTIQLLEEAVALENAGGTWTQKHASAVAGYSVAFLRNSDCPKHYEEGDGPKGKKRLVYFPGEVREWKRKRLITKKAG